MDILRYISCKDGQRGGVSAISKRVRHNSFLDDEAEMIVETKMKTKLRKAILNSLMMKKILMSQRASTEQ